MKQVLLGIGMAVTISLAGSFSTAQESERPSEFKSKTCMGIWDRAKTARDDWVKANNCVNREQDPREKKNCMNDRRFALNDFIAERDNWRRNECGPDVDLPDHPQFPETFPAPG